MNIYVANLAPEVTEETLQALFSPYGEIEKIRLMVDLQTNISKGYAFITMPDDELAENTIQQINGTMFMNKKIAVREAGKKVEKPILSPKPIKKPSFKPDLSIFDGLVFKGFVKFYDFPKGFGFILLENQREIFFHKTSLPTETYLPESGQNVQFNIQFVKKGFVAINLIFE